MGGGQLQFDNESSQASGIDFVQDAFPDISTPANSNTGFTDTVSTNPLGNFYGNNDAPKYKAKVLWIKDAVLVADRAMWINDRPTYKVIWSENFPGVEGYFSGSYSLLKNGGDGIGAKLSLRRIGDCFGVGGVIRRVQWILEPTTGTATVQEKIDAANVATFDFSSSTDVLSQGPKWNLYTSDTADATRDIHDYRIVANQADKLCVTGVVVYFDITGGAIDCFPGNTYINKTKISSSGTSLALPAVANFRGGRAAIYKTTAGAVGATTSLVTDVSTVAVGSSGTNSLTVSAGTGGSFLAGTVGWAAMGTTQYVGNVLSRSTDTLTMGITLPQGVSSSLYTLFQAGHTFPISATLTQQGFEFKADYMVWNRSGGASIGFYENWFYQDVWQRYRVWGGTLRVVAGTTMTAGGTVGIGASMGIELFQASSFLQIDGQFQALEFEFLAGQSGYIQATFGINGIPMFSIDEAFSGPGIFRKSLMVNAGPGWNSAVMTRGASHQQILVSKIVGYQNTVVNGPSFGVLANLAFGQTFVQREAINATLMAFGNVKRVYADCVYLKGAWTRGVTSTSAGGVFYNGTANTMIGRFSYYGTGFALVGAMGTSMTLTLDGLAVTPAFGEWIGLSGTNGFHTVDFNANTGNTRLEAIDFLQPTGELTSLQTFATPLVGVDGKTIGVTNGIIGIPDGAVTNYQLAPLNEVTLPVPVVATAAGTQTALAGITFCASGIRPVVFEVIANDYNFPFRSASVAAQSAAADVNASLQLFRVTSGVTNLVGDMIFSVQGSSVAVWPATGVRYRDEPPPGMHEYYLRWSPGTSVIVGLSGGRYWIHEV